MLTPLQQRLARTFLALPEAAEFALAGGAALVARGVVERPTQDLDFFVPVAEAVRLATDALMRVLESEELGVSLIRSGPSFARLKVADRREEVLVDLGFDHRLRPSEPGPFGQVLALEELAADKTLALFGRAEARDFVDVHALSERLGIERLLTLATEKDPGFDRYVMASMLGRFERLPPREFGLDDDGFDRLASFVREFRRQLLDEAFGTNQE